MDSDAVERKVSQSSSELLELRAAVRQLQARVDRQALAIQVLKDMLLSQPGFSEDGFLERLQRAAAQKADDKACRKCGKAISAKHSRCIYCGEQRPCLVPGGTKPPAGFKTGPDDETMVLELKRDKR